MLASAEARRNNALHEIDRYRQALGGRCVSQSRKSRTQTFETSRLARPLLGPAVTSERRRLANQANAKTSSGPKTKAGKARSARNALRHGLNIPISSDLALAAQAEAIARQIAGPDADAELLEQARRISQVSLQRVCARRTALILGHQRSPLIDRIERLTLRSSDIEMIESLVPVSLSRATRSLRRFQQNTCPSSRASAATSVELFPDGSPPFANSTRYMHSEP